jgi:hypothetical protein
LVAGVTSRIIGSLMRPLLLHVLLSGPLLTQAQTVFFHFTDGTTQNYAVTDIRKLTFIGDAQVLWLDDGSQYTWNVSTIGHYEFEENLGIEHIGSGRAPLQLSVYPNPATSVVTVETNLPHTARLVVAILDVQGRIVSGLYDGERPAGSCRIQWDATDGQGSRLAPGTYLVRLSTPDGSSAKPLVIQ